MTEVALSADATAQQRYAAWVLPEVEVLLRVARLMTKQPADAEDLVQDTLLRAWRSLDTFDGAYPRAWLLAILRNTHINRHRRRVPALLDDPNWTFDREAGQGEQHTSSEEIVIGRSFDAVVESALAALPDKFRQVLMLVDVDGLSYTEAAQVLGIPQGTVMSRLHRARKRIRDRLASADLAPRRRMK